MGMTCWCKKFYCYDLSENTSEKQIALKQVLCDFGGEFDSRDLGSTKLQA